METLTVAMLVIAILGMAGTDAGQELPPEQEAPPQEDPAKQRVAPFPGEPNPERRDAMGLTPPITGAELRARAEASYRRGFEFLVSCQNEDGSWGSHDPKAAFLKNFGFATANRGSQDGVRIACTAIVAKALLGKPERTDAERQALAAATRALLGTEKFAYHNGEAFNTWGYGYKLDFLCDFLESEEGESRREEVAAAATVCIGGLRRFQQADGGWNYYAGPMGDGQSMTFNTANFGEALYRARGLGLDVPEGMAEDTMLLLRHAVTPRGGIVYDARFFDDPNMVNELSAAARTAAVTEALAEVGLWGPAEMLRSVQVFDEGENWLEDGRKLIQPHTAVHQVSGYFFFYGYHYLSEFLSRLGDQAPRARWERNAWTMIRTQEEDGCWWDTPAADYGDKWGTGFALLVLQRYFENCPVETKAAEEGASAGIEGGSER